MFLQKLDRRKMLVQSARTAVLAATTSSLAPLFAAPASRCFKIGACDWTLGKRSDPAALEVAKEIGLDGVQVDMGTIANDMHLRCPEVQQSYLDASKRTGVELPSLAEAEFWQVPLKTDPRAAEWLSDSIDVCTALGMKVTMPACFEFDMNDATGIDHFVALLRSIAPKAEQQDVTIGLENWMSADDHLCLLDRVGSPAVKVYYDVGNSTDKGRDIFKEIRQLRTQICEIHFKDGNHLLGQGRIDFKKVREALDDIEYRGWLQIEAAALNDLVVDYRTNLKYLRGIFPCNT